MAREVKVVQPSNPTDEERHSMLRLALEEVGRIEDYDNLIELFILTILMKIKGFMVSLVL